MILGNSIYAARSLMIRRFAVTQTLMKDANEASELPRLLAMFFHVNFFVILLQDCFAQLNL